MENNKILIVEDHTLIAEAWKSILNNEEGFSVIGIAESQKEAIDFALNQKPNVILMDINIKEGSGFTATETISNRLAKTNIIGVSIHDDLALVKKMFKSGAKGYITKNSSKDELIRGIKEVLKGNEYICTSIKDKYFRGMITGDVDSKELTAREIDVVKLIAKGKTSKEIGEILDVSNRTIDTHRHNVLKKLQIPNSAQLSIWAKNKGYV